MADEFELSQAEQQLLLQAARTADLLDALQAELDVHGLTDAEGRLSPVVVELRQQRITLTRLIASLRLPDDDDVRPQRRGAARGAYGRPGDDPLARQP